MKLATGAGYWAAGPPSEAQETMLEAESLGFHSFWTAEAYGSDALTPLAWWGSQTKSIQLGTGIVQMSARTPAATAMAAMLEAKYAKGGPREFDANFIYKLFETVRQASIASPV